MGKAGETGMERGKLIRRRKEAVGWSERKRKEMDRGLGKMGGVPRIDK